MPICPYCGKSAGLFSKYHSACFEQAEQIRKVGSTAIHTYLLNAFKENTPNSDVRSAVNQLASQYKLSPEELARSVLGGIDDVSRDEPLEPTAAKRLSELA